MGLGELTATYNFEAELEVLFGELLVVGGGAVRGFRGRCLFLIFVNGAFKCARSPIPFMILDDRTKFVVR